MTIEEIRPSFSVYLIASDLRQLEGVSESLGLAGYMVANFSELTAAFSEVPSNPPHFIVFNLGETGFDLPKAIQQMNVQLPESHILILAPISNREKAVQLLERGVYDVIYTPLVSTLELTRALDRAAERDYFMYMNEKLSESANPVQVQVQVQAAPPTAGLDSGFVQRLFEQKTGDACIQTFLQEASDLLGGCSAVQFKWIPNRRVLMAAQGVNLGPVEINGLGVNFNETNGLFKCRDLENPMSVPELTEMVADVFGTTEFFARPIKVMGEMQGAVFFLCPEPAQSHLKEIDSWLSILCKTLGMLEAEKRLHVLAVKDPVTEVLNRPNFITRIQEEVSRSRRTHLPVSLLQVVIDQHEAVASQLGEEEARVILRMAARVFERYSRVNDIIGRTGGDEFGVLLPNTDREGALIKAERLRRTLETADFSKVLKDFPSITISIGVSEYPTLARDAEELLHSADEAVFQVRKIGNRTCVAQPSDNFTPDFTVQERGAAG